MDKITEIKIMRNEKRVGKNCFLNLGSVCVLLYFVYS